MLNKLSHMSLMAILLVFGVAISAQGFKIGVGSGGDARFLRLTGQLVCTECTMDEVKQAQPAKNLYELQYGANQKVVVSLDWDNEYYRDGWRHLVGLSDELWVRAADTVLQQISAEENMFKQFVMIATLRKSRTLDIASLRLSEEPIA